MKNQGGGGWGEGGNPYILVCIQTSEMNRDRGLRRRDSENGFPDKEPGGYRSPEALELSRTRTWRERKKKKPLVGEENFNSLKHDEMVSKTRCYTQKK